MHFSPQEEARDSLLYLLGFYTVNDGVHHRRCQQVDIGHENVDQWRGMLGKAVSHRHTNHGDIENQNSQHVRQAVVESPEPLSPSGRVQDAFQDKCIGDYNEQRVQDNNEQNQSKSIPAVDPDVSTDQVNHILVQAVGVRKKVGMAERQALEQEKGGKDSQDTAANDGQPNSTNDPIGEDGGIVEWAADGHITVKGHGQ